MLMQTEHFLQLKFYIKNIELTFILKYASQRKYSLFSSLASYLLLIIKNIQQNNGHFQHLLTADQF